MKFEQMNETVKTVKLIEKDFLRELTEEEKDIIVSKGWEYFLKEHLNITDEEFSTFKAIKNLISAYYTRSDEDYWKVLNSCDEEVYFTLREIVSNMEEKDGARTAPVTPDMETQKFDVKGCFKSFMDNLKKSLVPSEAAWFNKLEEEDEAKLLKLYKSEEPTCSDDSLSGIMVDAVKDTVIKHLAAQLKEGKTVDMTNDEFSEVADYLADHEDKIHLININGKVTLK